MKKSIGRPPKSALRVPSILYHKGTGQAYSKIGGRAFYYGKPKDSNNPGAEERIQSQHRAILAAWFAQDCKPFPKCKIIPSVQTLQREGLQSPDVQAQPVAEGNPTRGGVNRHVVLQPAILSEHHTGVQSGVQSSVPLTIRSLSKWYSAFRSRAHPDRKPATIAKDKNLVSKILRMFCKRYGYLPAERFTDGMLREFRDSLCAMKKNGTGAGTGKISRFTWQSVNKRIAIIKAMYQSGADYNRVSRSVADALKSVDRVRSGHFGVRRHDDVTSVSEHFVKDAMAHLSPVHCDMIKVMFLCGLRVEETCMLRLHDIDFAGYPIEGCVVWKYTVPKAKTSHHGHVTEKAIAPLAQRILLPYITSLKEQGIPAEQSFVFSPVQSKLWLRCKDKIHPASLPRVFGTGTGTLHYTTASFGRAIKRASNQAGKQDTPSEQWSPGQLRHSSATFLDNAVPGYSRYLLCHRSRQGITDTYIDAYDFSKIAQAAVLLDHHVRQSPPSFLLDDVTGGIPMAILNKRHCVTSSGGIMLSLDAFTPEVTAAYEKQFGGEKHDGTEWNIAQK